jgi:hypothetical protein
MGNFGAKARGYEKATMTVEQSVVGMINVIDNATRETHGGKMWTWDGRQVPWQGLIHINLQSVAVMCALDVIV